ncbi:uncharacterized protein LOC117188890 [Drosophila miranda]|uniref:uncharacterized protein LOC117188890 n=1 Tax=Drosophila miranda TaxID=7229 RepID=UPI00143F9851|nr:uncharacterized protein LOC117188890 [Drosophila miranda]
MAFSPPFRRSSSSSREFQGMRSWLDCGSHDAAAVSLCRQCGVPSAAAGTRDRREPRKIMSPTLHTCVAESSAGLQLRYVNRVVSDFPPPDGALSSITEAY